MDKFVTYPKINGKYNHYKGGQYEVITMATHSETQEPLVIYKSLLFGSIHARPLSMWFEEVDTGSSFRGKTKRFTEVV